MSWMIGTLYLKTSSRVDSSSSRYYDECSYVWQVWYVWGRLVESRWYGGEMETGDWSLEYLFGPYTQAWRRRLVQDHFIWEVECGGLRVLLDVRRSINEGIQ